MLGAALPTYLMAPTHAQIAIDVSVDIAPPPLPYYEQPPIPAEGYIWVPGYWAWDSAALDYFWVPGTWVEPPQPELLWTPAWWGWGDGHYGFHPGYWGREVGFYGGIDYGFGYTGEGYYGGRWDHGVFFYNRTVNNFSNVRVTNIYNQTVVINNNVNRVSFNGGNGGIQTRPTPQQQAFDRERHIEATPVQRQHAEVASKDRSLFSKQNHGEPPVAATPRAGVLQGEGVVRASRTPVAPAGEPGRPGQSEEMQGREPPRSGQESQRPGEPLRPNEPPRPNEAPRANEPPRPNEPPRANDVNREPPPRVEQRTPVEEQRREPQEAPKAEPPRAEPRPEARPEPPKAEERAAPPAPRVEERRPEPPPAPAAREAPPRMAPAPRAPAPTARPPAREEEKR
jgi:WXXGXW repeat (2 copies)